MERLDILIDRLSKRNRRGCFLTYLLEEATQFQLSQQVVRLIVAVGRVARDDRYGVTPPRHWQRAIAGDGKVAVRRQHASEARQHDVPVHPVQTRPRDDQGVGWVERDSLGMTLEPAQTR